MESLYGPRPDQRRRTARREPAAVPLWRKVLGTLTLIAVGVACFAVLVALEVEHSDDPLERLPRIPLDLRTPAFDLGAFDTPSFKPLQSAEIIPDSALRPAGADATAPAKRLQTAGIIVP